MIAVRVHPERDRQQEQQESNPQRDPAQLTEDFFYAQK
jgi:hypothetical protein